MYTPSDILIRKTADGDTIWVSQRLVVEYCGVSENLLRETCRKRYKQGLPASWAKVTDKAEFLLGDSGKAWRWGRKGGQYYYDYDRVPNRTPSNYRDMLPSKDELVEHIDQQNLRASRERGTQARNTLIEAVAAFENGEDVLWIQTQSGYQIDIATARDYGKALAWCRLIRQAVAARQFEMYGVATVSALYELCAETLSALRIKNLRIATASSLRNKIASMPGDIYDQRQWVISGKYGNDNRQIVGKINLIDYETGVIHPFDIHQAIMYASYMNIDNPQKESLKDLYETIYEPLISDFSLEAVEYRTFCHHLTRFSTRLKTGKARDGEDNYKKNLLTYIPSEKLQYAHSLFCGDGSGLFAYRYMYTGKNKHQELRYMNLYAMLISDVASGYIAGWAVAPQGEHCETTDMVRRAVQMAVANGSNQTMFEFVSDNHGAFTEGSQKLWLNEVFNRVRTIERHNSQANPAETQFRLFKNSTLRSLKNFVRTSHNASVENRANLDNVQIWEYPTYNEALVQLQERIDAWNNKPRPGHTLTPAQIFAENKNPNCAPMNDIQLRRISGTHAVVEVSRMRGFVVVGPKRQEKHYEILDYNVTGANLISQATGNGYYADVHVMYDENGADLYSSDGKYIMTCPRVGKAMQALVEKTDQHRLNESHLAARKVHQMNQVNQFEQDVRDASELLSSFDYDSALLNGGNKEVINGKYENFINTSVAAAVTKTAKKNLVKLEIKEQRAEQKSEAKKQESDAAHIQAQYLARIRNQRNKNQQQ